MAGQRSAGYCPNCNRGVSIVRPQRDGFINKMKSALQQTDDDTDWVCTKCGVQARRGFAPPPTETGDTESVENTETEQKTQAPQAAPGVEQKSSPKDIEPSAPDTRTCPACNKLNPSMAAKCKACNAEMNVPSSYDATCHLCDKSISFNKEAAGTPTKCPSCSADVILPEMTNDASALTRAPFIIKLDDDPERPDISKALCTQCNFELTYPKRLSGKYVDCPSCSIKFTLP